MLGVFSLFGNESAAVAVILILISSLSVCAAVLIYRVVKAQRERNRGEDVALRPRNETEIRAEEQQLEPVEDNEDWSRSTGKFIN